MDSTKYGTKSTGNPAPEESPADPDLAAIVAAWPMLPAPIRAGVLALVKAGTPTA